MKPLLFTDMAQAEHTAAALNRAFTDGLKTGQECAREDFLRALGVEP